MKKTLALLVITLTTALSLSARDEYRHDDSALPSAAQIVLQKNFKSKVSLVKIEKTLGRIDEYEVILQDGTEVSFDRSGNWKEVNTSIKNKVPDSMVPTEILKTIKQHQGNVKVVGIEKERGGYDVELSNGVEMKFDTQGRFLRYDK